MRDVRYSVDAEDRQDWLLLGKKLHERIAAERVSAALFGALARKYKDILFFPLSQATLALFQQQEEAHLRLIERALHLLQRGVSVFCAPVEAHSASAGLLKIVESPQSSIAEDLEVSLMMELHDSLAWELLIPLAERAHLAWLAWEFQGALTAEKEQVRVIREARERCLERSWNNGTIDIA